MGEFQRSPSKVWWGNNFPRQDKIENKSWIHHIKDSSIEETFERNDNLDSDNYIVHYNHSPRQIELNSSANNNQNRNDEIIHNISASDNQLSSTNRSWLNRTSSGSPNSHKSQDSGFSDSETSPVLQQALNTSEEERKSNYFCRQNSDADVQYDTNNLSTKLDNNSITPDLLKDTNLNETPIKNFTTFIKEKYSPKKSLASQLNEKSLNKTFTQHVGSSKEFVDLKTTCKSLPATPDNSRHYLQYSRCGHSHDPQLDLLSNKGDHELVTSFKLLDSPETRPKENELRYGISPYMLNQRCSHFQNRTLSPSTHWSNRSFESKQKLHKTEQKDLNTTQIGHLTVSHRQSPVSCDPVKEHSKKIRNSPRHSPKVNRNLLSCFPSNGNSLEDVSAIDWEPQIISDDNENKVVQTVNEEFSRVQITNKQSPNVSKNDKNELFHNESSVPSIEYPTVIQNGIRNKTVSGSKSPTFVSYLNRTFPQINGNQRQQDEQMNVTAPVGDQLKYDPNNISFQDVSSSSETTQYTIESPKRNEISVDKDFSRKSEDLFENCVQNIDHFELPSCTSTPKCVGSVLKKDMLRRNHAKQLINKDSKDKSSSPLNLPKINAPSVSKWLDELANLYEAECMVTLQSKSLAADLSRQVAEAAATATTTIKSLLALSKIIYAEFSTIQKQLSSDNHEHLGPLIQSLAGNITEFILTFSLNTQAGSLTKTNQREQEVHEMLNICDSLRQSTSQNNFDDLLFNIGKLKSIFRETEINILTCQIQLLINMIEEPTSELVLRGAVQALTWIAAQGYRNGGVNLIKRLVICGAPRALLLVCLESKASTLRASALRALATVCCSSVAIRQLEQAGGIEILAEILSETSRPEPELSEAAAVIAQITAPWIEDNHSIIGLKENAKSIIQSLTHLFQTTHCCQILLLCAAALANLSSMEPTSVWPLLQCRTAEKLLQAVQRRGPKVSVFLKEQTATLVANMSAASESRLQLGEGKAVVAMLCFLQTRPEIADNSNDPEHKATQRLLQKASIALSRLCSEQTLAQQVVELGGVPQLIRLCKEKRERGHSDAVLVACLATLRKITSNCGLDVMEEQDAMELVEPKLLDSFLTYSSQNESYV